MARKKTRLKKGRILFALILLGALVLGAYKGIMYLNYTKTYEYKLIKAGYVNDNKTIIEYLKEEEINKIIDMGYNENVANIVKEKYFLFKNITKYLDYIDLNPDKSLTDVVSIINIGADKDFYTDIKTVDMNIDDPYLILVNKYHILNENYGPDSVVDVSSQFAYAGIKIDESIYGVFRNMWYDAKDEGLTLILTSGFRDYNLQKTLYVKYSASHGKVEADRFSARPGHSEHQLGFALDIVAYGYGLVEEFEQSDEFAWLQEHAYEYGFIMRYPKDKEYLTGYSYEPWHYRYVGKEVAKYIHENNITYDEYYAYFIEK